MNAIDDALKTIGETFCWDTEKGEAQRRMVREKLEAIAKAARREGGRDAFFLARASMNDAIAEIDDMAGMAEEAT